MRRVVLINKCEDCPREDCELRLRCGRIPDDCKLPTGLEWEHRLKPVERPAEASGTAKASVPINAHELLRYGGSE